MNPQVGKVRALGEVALRVTDLDRAVAFYRDVLQLSLMRRTGKLAFFELAPGFAGHTQVLALFDRSDNEGYKSPDGPTTTLDHLAFTILAEDFEREKKRLMDLGHKLTFAEHAWVQWRSLYLKDPDGNTVELVCFDETIERVSPED
jgi:catechol 2,3-dioxygenase